MNFSSEHPDKNRVSYFSKKHSKILTSLVVLLAVNAVSLFILFRQNQNPVHLSELQSQQIQKRSPASINKVENSLIQPLNLFADEPAKKIAFETTLKMSCEEIFEDKFGLKQLNVNSNHITLQMTNCFEQAHQVNNLKLLNQTNGYSAQLFKINKTDAKTDFIQLENGDNILHFEISLNDGQKKTQTLRIHRLQ